MSDLTIPSTKASTSLVSPTRDDFSALNFKLRRLLDASTSERLDAHVKGVFGPNYAPFVAALEASSGIIAGAFVADALSGNAGVPLSVDVWVPAEDVERVLASLDDAAQKTIVEAKGAPEREQVEAPPFSPHAEDEEREKHIETVDAQRAAQELSRNEVFATTVADRVATHVANRPRLDHAYYKLRPATGCIGEWATAVHKFTADGVDTVINVIALSEGVDVVKLVCSFDHTYAQLAARPEFSEDTQSVEWLFAGPGVDAALKRRSSWSEAALDKLGSLPCAAANEWVRTLERGVWLAERGIDIDFHGWWAAFTAWRSKSVMEVGPKGPAAALALRRACRAEKAIAIYRLTTNGDADAAQSYRLWNAIKFELSSHNSDDEADYDAEPADAEGDAGGDFADIPLVGFSASDQLLDALDETVIDEAWDKWHREAVAADSLPFVYDDNAEGVPYEHPWTIATHKVSRQIAPTTKLSPEARAAILSRLEWMFNEIVDEAMRVEVPQRRATLSSRSVQTAVRLSLPGELAKHAVSEGTKAVTKFTAA